MNKIQKMLTAFTAGVSFLALPQLGSASSCPTLAKENVMNILNRAPDSSRNTDEVPALAKRTLRGNDMQLNLEGETWRVLRGSWIWEEMFRANYNTRLATLDITSSLQRGKETSQGTDNNPFVYNIKCTYMVRVNNLSLASIELARWEAPSEKIGAIEK